ncbi:glycosyltransferase family A protein [Stenotrophomonas sp.]|uniref:glycosyltransferase family 2 protein n=1 Tax=Stenotrophomonas sp. TaxID=69392 RepID=UPI0028A7E02C|nr:glycosyltransferase family A protein [Stenotrophomonas sp.]
MKSLPLPLLMDRGELISLSAPDSPISGTPLISVVMTCYNSMRWLDAAIQSLLTQTWDNFELILVDDGSTDGTRSHITTLARDEPRIRAAWMQHNKGTYAAKNAGIRLARGEVITFADSDDVSSPERLEAQLEMLRAPGLVATTCNYERRTIDDKIVLNRGLAARQALISMMIKRHVINEIGWFDGSVRVAADDEFFERLRAVYGRSAHANVQRSLYIALYREGSLSNDNSKDARIDMRGEELPPARALYKRESASWHAAERSAGLYPYMPYIQNSHPFWE